MTDIKSVINLPPPDQIGIVVKDVDAAVDYYSSTFGWGPFHTLEMPLEGFTYKGKSGNCRLKLAFAQSGPLEIELLEVLEGDTPHSQFLKERGEGVQHLRFSVDNLEGMLAKLARAGIEPVFYHHEPELGVSLAYIDSGQLGDVMFELMEIKAQQGEPHEK